MILRRVVLGVVRCLAAALCLAGGARADTRALLVGVSAYDESIGLASLRGPANDVRLLRDVLAARGVADIRVLADGVEGADLPTRAAILAGFAGLAADSRPGDLVFIHLSGHGTRQPDQNADETDGLDEVFLPADTGRAEPGARGIPNAIIDDEIGDMVLAIRQTGADVWLVMDSCHSGSGLRAAGPDVAVRWVDPAVLGVAADATVAEASSGMLEAHGRAPAGQVVAFYAARSSEVAREVNLAPDAPGDSGWYGLFTSRLAGRMQAAEGLSYRQLFQAVLADMNDAAVPGDARMQTPGWEGGLIDAAVLGGQATSGLRQFAVTGDEVAAGLVQGFGPGTLLALVADAADPPDSVLVHAQIEEAAATFGYLRPVAADCVPRSDALCAAAGALPPEARFARLVARPLDLVLRLSPPRDLLTGATLPPDHPAGLALAEAVRAVNGGGVAQVALDAAAFDIEVAGAPDGRLWFGRKVVLGEVPVGLSWQPGGADPLAAVLTRIAQAEQLASLLESVAGGGSLLNPSPVEVQADLLASRLTDLDPPGQGSSAARECRRAQGALAGTAAAPLPEVADLKQCDRLTFSARGAVRGGRDVNRIHIDSRFCIHAAYAHIEDEAAASALGPPMDMCSDCPDGYSAGDERLFVIVTEQRANAEALNLEGLVENCTGLAPTRSAAARQVSDVLTALGRRPDTRGSFGGLDIADVWVTQFRWQVLPKEVLFPRVSSAQPDGGVPSAP